MRRNVVRSLVVLTIVVTGLTVPAVAAEAASFTVIACDPASSADETDFQNAVALANDETAHAGADTIHLQVGCTYSYSAPAVAELIEALPAITSRITIEGHGATIRLTGTYVPAVTHIFRVETTGNLTVRDVTLKDAVGEPGIGGAAIYNIGTTHIDDSTIKDNNHGAVFNYWGKLLTVTDSTFDNNDAILSNGGAIENQGRLIVADSTFTSNWALRNGDDFHSGGAIYSGNEGVAIITDSTFDRNGSTNHGGAVFSFSPITITDSIFTRNSTFLDGGAYFNWADGSVSRSYFGNNRAFKMGGGIYSAANLTITNSTFYKNVSDEGGGAIKNQSTTLLSITSSTFAENDSLTDEGDAVSQSSTSTGTTKNSLFAGHAKACFQLASSGNNMVDQFDPTCSGSFMLDDPKLQAPAMNGGDTPTMKFGAGSKALDRIVSTDCPSTDQRSQPRPAGTKCDVGAFEDQVPSIPGTPTITVGGPSPSKTGVFTIGWGGSTDPDGPVNYRLYRRDANDAAWSVVVSITASRFWNVSEAEGTYAYQVAALDGNHEVFSSALDGVVVDKTAPAAATLAPDRVPEYAPPGGTAWYRGTVTVTISANGDPALADGSAGSGVATVTPSPTFNTSGTHIASGVVTDVAGNASTPVNLTVNVDAENPAVAFASCPATVLLGHAAQVSWAASDPSSGLATPAGGNITLDTSSIGAKSVVANATDNVLYSASATCAFNVIYDFTGFLDPVGNPPTVNEIGAGRVVTATFSLAGNQGMGVIAAGYPQSVDVLCTSFGENTTGSPTAATKPGLSFSPGSGGRYTYPWKTATSWRGTCRQLIIKLDDGTYHRANFRFL